MSDGRFLDASHHGIFATHPDRIDLPAMVSPSEEDKFNTIRYPLVAIACAQLPDDKFDFDSSFLVAGVTDSMSKLAALVKLCPGCPLSIFGHADPVGSDDYNKSLSGRRAMAVYGMLIRNADIWDDIFTDGGVWAAALASDHWGDRALQQMLAVVTDPLGDPYYSGPIDGQENADYDTALKTWRKDNGVSAGPVSRKKLYSRYMDAVCTDAAGQPFSLQTTDFLAQGAGDQGKGDVQGCSDFNPILLFSQEEETDFLKPENRQARNEANRPNRRVLAFLFRKGSVVDPTKWPCPKAKEGSAGCRDRFWSDADARRKTHLPGERREFNKTEDTLACRFYHGLAFGSPCEDTVKQWNIRLLVAGPNGNKLPVANRKFAATTGDAETAAVVRGTTDAEGIFAIPVIDEQAQITLRIDAWDALVAKPAASGGGASGGSGSSGNGASGSGAANGSGSPSGGAPTNGGSAASGAGSGTDGNASTGSAAPTQSDLDAEAHYMVLILKAGDLQKMDVGDPAARQRLYNLGYGQGDFTAWTPDQYQRYLKAFQHDDGLSDQSGTLTDETQTSLKSMHGS